MRSTRLVNVYKDAETTILAIQTITQRQRRNHQIYHVYGSIDPIAIVKLGPRQVQAFDIRDGPIALDRLTKIVPELEGIVARWRITQIA